MSVYTLVEITHSVGVETGAGTYGSMHCVAKGVVHSKMYHKVAETAVGVAEILSKISLIEILSAVGVETGTGAHGAMHCIAKGVGNCKVDDKVVETAVGSTKMLSVNTLIIIRPVVLSAHRSVAHMTVGVEMRTGTYHRVYGVAYGVVHRQIDDKVVETAVGSTKMLSVNTLIVVGTIVLSAHRSVAHMTVGVETCAGTYHGVYGVAHSVVHRQIDDEVVETAVGSTKILSINTLIVVRTIVLSAHRSIAHVTVGVETCTGTYHGMYGVAQGVVYSKVYNKVAETAVGITEILCVIALIVILHPVGVETDTGTNGAVHGVAQGVVNGEVYHKVAITAVGVAMVLCMITLIIVAHPVGVETCSGTYGAVYCIANGVVDNKMNYEVAIAASDCVKKILGVVSRQEISHTIGVETDTGTYRAVNGVAQGVVNGEVYHKVVIATVRVAKMLCVITLIVILNSVGVETGTGADNRMHGVP